MDACLTNWLSEWQVDEEDLAFADETPIDDLIDPFSVQSFLSDESFSPNKRIMSEESSIDEKPPKKLKTTKRSSSLFASNNNLSSSSITISFANESASLPRNNSSNHFYGNINVSSSISQDGFEIPEGNKNVSTSTTRTGVQAQDHVLAERKRRERLTERFVALSTLIPQLTKMDKASVLTDAINYIKELKERVEMLEGEVKEREYVETTDCSSIVKTDPDGINESLPEIEVKMVGKSLVIRIYSKNKTGFIVKALSEIEKLKLNIISSNVVPFADNTQLITTIISQINDEFNMTANDVALNLHSTIQELM